MKDFKIGLGTIQTNDVYLYDGVNKIHTFVDGIRNAVSRDVTPNHVFYTSNNTVWLDNPSMLHIEINYPYLVKYILGEAFPWWGDNLEFKYYPTLSVFTVDINQRKYCHDTTIEDRFFVADEETLHEFFENDYHIVSSLYIKLHYPKFLVVLEREMRYECN